MTVHYTAAALLDWFGPDTSARTIAHATGVTTRFHQHLDTIWNPHQTIAA